MKKIIAIMLSLVMALGLCACSVEQTGGSSSNSGTTTTQPSGGSTTTTQPSGTTTTTPTTSTPTEISLWTYPVGSWGDQATVEGLMAGFEAATGIKVNVE